MVLNGSVAYVAFRLAAVLQQTFWALKVGIVNCQNTQYAGFFFSLPNHSSSLLPQAELFHISNF